MKEEDIRKKETLNRYLDLVQKDCERFLENTDKFVQISCPACGMRETNLEFKKQNFEYVSCVFCHTLYAKNRPDFKILSQFYKQCESSTYWVDHFFKPVAEARRKKIFKPRADFVVSYFQEDSPRWHIADIGAGFGLFLDELRKQWPQSTYIAVEPSAEQSKICSQQDFVTEECTLEEISGYNEKLDLITAFELFEHLHDPHRFLAAVYDLLKPEGFLLLTTLNGLGFDIQVLWERSKSIYPPHHINFFNPDSMGVLLKRAGFEVVNIETPGKLAWDIVQGGIDHKCLKEHRFWQNLARNGSADCKHDFQNWLAKYKLSSHMRVLARKMIKE